MLWHPVHLMDYRPATAKLSLSSVQCKSKQGVVVLHLLVSSLKWYILFSKPIPPKDIALNVLYVSIILFIHYSLNCLPQLNICLNQEEGGFVKWKSKNSLSAPARISSPLVKCDNSCEPYFNSRSKPYITLILADYIFSRHVILVL